MRAETAYRAAQAETTSSEAVTSKHDRCRLIHLFSYARAIRMWNRAMTPRVIQSRMDTKYDL
jgi:hypothetical protein